MVNLITLKGSRHTSHKLLFSKTELTKILNAYSNGVIKDHWRDYAIDQTGKISIFSIFKNSREKATFCITKRRENNKKLERFSLEYRLRTVEVSSNLDKILKRLENMPKLILFFLISIFYFNILQAETIKKIEIVGNKRVSPETIKLYGGIEINKNYYY